MFLTNYELWQYIQIAIARNHFNGTYEEIKEVYQKAGLDVIYVTVNPMKCNICIKDNDNLSQNIKNLLQQGNILIKSVGIEYSVIFYRDDNSGFILDEGANLDNFTYVLR